VRRAVLGALALAGALTLANALRPAPPELSELPTLLAGSAHVRATLDRWTEGDDSGWWIAVRLPRDAVLEIVPSDTVVPFEQLLPTDDHDWVAVNGGFYDADRRPMGLVVSEGHLFHPLGPSGSGVLEGDPLPMRVVHRDAWQPGALMALQSIDRLVDAGVNLVQPRAGAHRDARAAVALSADAAWAVVAFSDRSAGRTDEGFRLSSTSGHGLTLAGFAALLVDRLGAGQALNLDGAVSTQLAARVGGASVRVVGERGTVQAVVLRTESSRTELAPPLRSP
jgi:hypothetical protein